MAQSSFETFIAEEIEKQKGLYIPIKASARERLMVKKAPCSSLHPNPEDEFCFPDIGPSFRIINEYVSQIQKNQRAGIPLFDEPITVEKTRPDGYMLLNGHHRWAAAMKFGLKTVPIRIINLPLESDIEKMMEKSLHDKRVTLDLDEVIFRRPEDPNVEQKPGSFSKKAKVRCRLGVPALFHYLTKNGYDIWVYSGYYYSIDDVEQFFGEYSVQVDGINVGDTKKRAASKAAKRMDALIRNKYAKTIHIDNDMLLVTKKENGNYEEVPVNVPETDWAKEVIRLIGEMDSNEKK